MIPVVDLGEMTSQVRREVSAAWEDLLDSNQFIGGSAVAKFEADWAGFCQTSYAVGVANGTDALYLALRAMDIGPGDDVVVPTNTFVATPEAVVLAGANPCFADVDPDTLLITDGTLKAAVTPATRAVIVVHLYGQMADMTALSRTAAELGIEVIEDAAQAQGGRWEGAMAGSLGRVGCFSFYPGKNLGAFGDAGAVTTSDPAIAERIISLRDHGRVPGEHNTHGVVGTNSRLDAVQAAVLTVKLKRLDGWNQGRRSLLATYRELLNPELAPLVAEADGAYGVHHLAVVRVRQRERVRAELAQRGIATGIHYPTPCHQMAPYAHYPGGSLPVAEAAAAEVMSLPLYPDLSPEQVRHVSAELNAVVVEEALR